LPRVPACAERRRSFRPEDFSSLAALTLMEQGGSITPRSKWLYVAANKQHPHRLYAPDPAADAAAPRAVLRLAIHHRKERR
jgi:hypothetical protein